MNKFERIHTPLYQLNSRYFAQVAGGLEELGAKELASLGATNINIINRGMDFTADQETLFRINYRSRLMTRILAPIMKFTTTDPDSLYLNTKRFDWTHVLGLDQTFAVMANVSYSQIDHSQFAALKVKDSVVDMFRKRFKGKRPSIDTDDPDMWIALHIHENQATLSIDCSGGSLHKRGYRQRSVEAPIMETLAAAILEISGWDGKTPIYDPMCGSGTLLSEAWLKAGNIPPGTLRKKFGFMSLPDYDRRVWVKVKFEEDNKTRMVRGGMIRGSDIDSKAVAMTRGNNARIPGGDELRVKTSDFRDLPDMEGRLIVCNPPYGIRLMKDEDMGAFMKDFGDFLKQKCKGSQAFIYFGDKELVKMVGLKTSMKMPLRNGGLDGRLVWYELY
jgi:putative N6-adenine-specific DNA methylase